MVARVSLPIPSSFSSVDGAARQRRAMSNLNSALVVSTSTPRAVSRGVGGMSGSTFSKFGNDGRDRVVDFLTRRHPVKTAECVESETGIPASTVRKWLAGTSAPGFAALRALIGAYGSPFIASAMGIDLLEMTRRMCADNERALAENERELAARRARNEELRALLAK
jgi:hypothetical protein